MTLNIVTLCNVILNPFRITERDVSLHSIVRTATDEISRVFVFLYLQFDDQAPSLSIGNYNLKIG